MSWRAKNALGTETMTDLRSRLRDAAGAPVLLTGTGDAFSAGLNLKEVASLDAAGMRAFLDLLESLMVELFQYPGPVVAHVNGHAIAGGCILAIACDHRVAQRGRRVAPPHLDRVVLCADLFGPDGALRTGLLDELADDAGAVARARLETLAAYPAEAYARNKLLLRGNRAADLVPDDVAARAFEQALPVWTSVAVKERVTRLLAR